MHHLVAKPVFGPRIQALFAGLQGDFPETEESVELLQTARDEIAELVANPAEPDELESPELVLVIQTLLRELVMSGDPTADRATLAVSVYLAWELMSEVIEVLEPKGEA